MVSRSRLLFLFLELSTQYSPLLDDVVILRAPTIQEAGAVE